MQIQMENAADQLAYKSSPEGSPRSHITIQDLNGTPSSQVSVKAKRNKVDKSGSSQSRKSLSAGKKSPSNPNHDSSARSSTGQYMDSKNGKRRNSFGSTKPGHVDQDQRDNSSSKTQNLYFYPLNVGFFWNRKFFAHKKNDSIVSLAFLRNDYCIMHGHSNLELLISRFFFPRWIQLEKAMR
ncbi:hypothetical protein IFM89_018076 [Coptis chinensis]|uniref:Uncharacterized protein n=1 Tax=Coptis chinensis TaxID=261450 RepID=A0A835IEJ6_9MAGN|nr:hypothetical protein IFM89_018076 [Coptis chinensis]